MFYVPVRTFDDTTPIVGDFHFAFFNAEKQGENERGDRKALLHYLFSDDRHHTLLLPVLKGIISSRHRPSVPALEYSHIVQKDLAFGIP
jgi:hypothetical protein